jgi:hypothetical protein
MFAAVNRAFAVCLDSVCLMYATCVMLSFLVMSEGELNIPLFLLMCTKGMEDLVFLHLLYLLTQMCLERKYLYKLPVYENI